MAATLLLNYPLVLLAAVSGVANFGESYLPQAPGAPSRPAFVRQLPEIGSRAAASAPPRGKEAAPRTGQARRKGRREAAGGGVQVRLSVRRIGVVGPHTSVARRHAVSFRRVGHCRAPMTRGSGSRELPSGAPPAGLADADDQACWDMSASREGNWPAAIALPDRLARTRTSGRQENASCRQRRQPALFFAET